MRRPSAAPHFVRGPPPIGWQASRPPLRLPPGFVAPTIAAAIPEPNQRRSRRVSVSPARNARPAVPTIARYFHSAQRRAVPGMVDPIRRALRGLPRHVVWWAVEPAREWHVWMVRLTGRRLCGGGKFPGPHVLAVGLFPPSCWSRCAFFLGRGNLDANFAATVDVEGVLPQ